MLAYKKPQGSYKIDLLSIESKRRQAIIRKKHREILTEAALYVLTAGVFLSMIYVVNLDIVSINRHHLTVRDILGADDLKKVQKMNLIAT